MSPKPYFAGPYPRILAHRGLALAAPQNSVDAFRAALDAGATHLETDARASADGHAVLVHDPDLGSPGTDVAGYPLAELRRLVPGVCTLPEALAALPGGRFNIDVKAADAVGPVVEAVRAAGAVERVLITSFADERRRAAVDALPGIATSASRRQMLASHVPLRAGVVPLVRLAFRGIDAAQIPERALGLDMTAPRVVARFHRAGVEVHFWVVNDPRRMRQLVAAGADGVVTDRTDLAAEALR